MKRLIYSLIATLACCLMPGAGQAHAATTGDALSVSVTETQPYSKWMVEVSLNATTASYTAFQMDITLPEGFAYVEGSATAGAAIAAHNVAAATHPDGFVRVVAYSGSNAAISTGSNILVSLELEAEAAAVAGTSYSLGIGNIRFSLRNGTEQTLPDVAAHFACTGMVEPAIHHAVFLVDGHTYADIEVAYGDPVTPPAPPAKEGHTFTGWDGLPDTMPDNDVSVTAMFSVNSYTATYFLNREIYDTQLIAYGEPVNPPQVSLPEGYIFSGWQDVPATMPARDISIYGTSELSSGVQAAGQADSLVDVFSLTGRLVKRGVAVGRMAAELPAGIYVAGGRVVVVR